MNEFDQIRHMKFRDVVQVEYNNNKVVLCYGSYWKIISSQNPNSWINNGYASMDYINYNTQKKGMELY